MGSLNDYSRFPLGNDKERKLGWKGRLALQSLAAAAFFLLVASCVTGSGPLGQMARYIAGPALSADSSWVNFNDAMAVSAPLSAAGEESAPPESAPGALPEQDPSEPPDFTAPASGVVVTELAVAAAGFPTSLGILIQGSPGQSVKASAQGVVAYLGENEDGYLVELRHSGGFTSLYQGLSEIEVGHNEELALGQPLGATADGELIFSLLKEGEEVNPLDYLFR